MKSALSPGASPITVLVANKNDLRDGTIDSRAEYTSSDGKSFASSLGTVFFESSAVSLLFFCCKFCDWFG